MHLRSSLRLLGALAVAATMSIGAAQPAAAFSQEASDNIAEFFRCKTLMLTDFAAFKKQCGGTPNMSDLTSMASGHVPSERKRHECWWEYEGDYEGS